MTIAARLESHLKAQHIPFTAVPHPYSATASETAEAAHIPGDHLAKSVVIHMEDGPLLAVLPSNHMIDLSALQEIVQRRLGLAPEDEVEAVFDDCDKGAAPPIGAAYGLRTIVDDSLTGLDRVWFEAGDHITLIRVKGRDFDQLLSDADHGNFSRVH